MSLSVNVFVVDGNGERQVRDLPEGCSDLAGFESWRSDVWASRTVRSLGAQFFPVLADTDLQIEPGQIPAFLRECALLRENLETIVAGTDPARTVEEHRYVIGARLANIEQAARRAEALGGGVLIG